MLYYNNKKNAQKNFSVVKGFLEGIILDGKINSQEIKSLQDWINNILDSSDLGGYKGYFIRLHNESCLPTFDIERAKDLILEVQEFEYELDNYSVEDTEYQILVGILKGLIADEIIGEDEVIGLKEWLKKNSHLSNHLIYKQLLDIVNSNDENGLNIKLIRIINDFLCSEKNRKEVLLNESDFANYTFCFTGNFINWTRSELVKQLRERGVEIKSSISKKINFLIIGEIKNTSNKYDDFGTKTEKVRELQSEGAEIEILYEGQIVNSFNNFLNVNLKD
jgi:hypothetical protein